jgi:hypothetical protein
MTLFSVSRNGGTPLVATHPAALRWIKKYGLPLEVGTYERGEHIFTVTNVRNHPETIAAMKKELRARARAKFGSEIEEKYTTLEIACLTAMQVEKPARFATMKSYIAPRTEILVAKLAEIAACTTYEQLVSVVI